MQYIFYLRTQAQYVQIQFVFSLPMIIAKMDYLYVRSNFPDPVTCMFICTPTRNRRVLINMKQILLINFRLKFESDGTE